MPTNVDAAKLCQINLKAETMWNDSQAIREIYTPNCETAKALASNNNAVLTELFDTSRPDNAKVKVTWLDGCSTELKDCGDVCEIGEGDTNINSKEYDVTLCKETEFSLDENQILGLSYSFEEFVARKLLLAKKSLDEWVNGKALEFLSASAGFNKAPQFAFSNNIANVPSASYNMQLMKAMYKESMLNKIASPFLIDSGNLWDYYFDAELKKDDCCGKADAKASKLFTTYFDMPGFPAASLDEESFLIGRNSYAFGSKVWNPQTTPTYIAGNVQQFRYHIASDNIAGMNYDVFYTFDCSGNRLLHKWKVKATPFFGLNPEGCANVDGEKVTGILAYNRIAA